MFQLMWGDIARFAPPLISPMQSNHSPLDFIGGLLVCLTIIIAQDNTTNSWIEVEGMKRTPVMKRG